MVPRIRSVEQFFQEALAALVISGLIADGGGLGIGGSCRPPLFTVDQPFEFPAVEEDPSTVAAVVNGDTAAFVLAHGAMALWAEDFGHKNTVRHSATGRKSTGVSPPRPSDAVVSLDPVQALREWGAAQCGQELR